MVEHIAFRRQNLVKVPNVHEATEQLGLPLSVKLVRPGFFPKGGGEILALIPGRGQPKPLRRRVRGNLRNVEPSPEHVHTGMQLRLCTYSLGTDDNGVEAIGFGFEPA